MYQSCCHTYESASLRMFRRGRTDTIRSASTASASFVKAFDDPGKQVSSSSNCPDCNTTQKVSGHCHRATLGADFCVLYHIPSSLLHTFSHLSGCEVELVSAAVLHRDWNQWPNQHAKLNNYIWSIQSVVHCERKVQPVILTITMSVCTEHSEAWPDGESCAGSQVLHQHSEYPLCVFVRWNKN